MPPYSRSVLHPWWSLQLFPLSLSVPLPHSWCTGNGWPTPARHKGRRTGRQPATRGARRASRSLHSLLSQRPAHPTHRPGRARPRGPSRRRPAAVGVRNGCPDLPAGCLRAACRCSAACCWSSACQPCLLGACCSGLIPVRTLFSPAAFGGVWGCWRCRAWHWAGAETCFVVRFEWSTGFEFLTVFPMPPAPFRCQLNRQPQSRHRGGPGRTLVCIQRTPSARAMPPPT